MTFSKAGGSQRSNVKRSHTLHTVPSPSLPGDVEIEMVYQPIISTADGQVRGIEALARFSDGQPPDVWFRAAARGGWGVELELAAVAKALRDAAAADLAEGTYVAVNVGPETLVSPALMPILAAYGGPIVVELTEHVEVVDYPSVVEAVASLRENGFRIAVDDAGTGYAGLNHILQLQPDFIKLDRSLVSGLADDPAKRALISAMSGFARDVGCEVIAEGVESFEEFHALVAAGIRLAQGYLFARPMPLPIVVNDALARVRQPRVLLVDDDPAVRRFFDLVLSRGGFEVIGQCDSVVAGLERTEQDQPDVILLDVQMPGTRGDDAIPLFRQAAPGAVIIVCSSEDQSSTKAQLADAYLPKAGAIDGIGALLRQVLNKSVNIDVREHASVDWSLSAPGADLEQAP